MDDRCLSALLSTLNRTALVNNQNEAVLWHYWAIPEKKQTGAGVEGVMEFPGGIISEKWDVESTGVN